MERLNPITKKHSITIKAVVIGILILLMLIPVSMVKSLIREREDQKESVRNEITSKWGGRQQILGPVLAIPYITGTGDKARVSYAYFLPDEYKVNGTMEPENRSRGIYEVLCYQSKMNIQGKFSYPELGKLNITSTNILWNEAFITMGIPHLQGIKNKIIFSVNGVPREIISSVVNNDLVQSGLTIKVPIDAENKSKTYSFSLDLSLNGSNGLYFVPIGKHTSIEMKSDYKTVTFIGDLLPNKRNVDKEGFAAQWDIYDYNLNYVPAWTGSNPDLGKVTLGVDLLLPVDQYQKTMRSAKYAIMFIALTFLVFFMVELLNHKQIHPVQYLLVSLALVLFYSLLLSLSEQVGFGLAYIISAFAVVALIASYSYTIFKEVKRAVVVGIFLSVLYMFLYVVLQLEDMALLLGSIGLFVILAIVMFASRKINWYREE